MTALKDAICPLYVVRRVWDDERDDERTEVGVCGEALWLDLDETLYLQEDGSTSAATGPTWKVTCCNGHVLFVPDHGGDDNYFNLPWKREYVGFAMGVLSTSANELGEGSAEPTPTMGTSAPDTLPPGRDERTQAEDRGASPLYPSEAAMSEATQVYSWVFDESGDDGKALNAALRQMWDIATRDSAVHTPEEHFCHKTHTHDPHVMRCPGAYNPADDAAVSQRGAE